MPQSIGITLDFLRFRFSSETAIEPQREEYNNNLMSDKTHTLVHYFRNSHFAGEKQLNFFTIINTVLSTHNKRIFK